MDFTSGLAQIEAESYDDPPPANKLQAFWQWLVSIIFWLCKYCPDQQRQM
jgi:hypothetical protein